ncbi:MAG: MucBP domain-containing protein [Lachnospiraceae bacterium]|jgi:hypothetical protein
MKLKSSRKCLLALSLCLINLINPVAEISVLAERNTPVIESAETAEVSESSELEQITAGLENSSSSEEDAGISETEELVPEISEGMEESSISEESEKTVEIPVETEAAYEEESMLFPMVAAIAPAAVIDDTPYVEYSFDADLGLTDIQGHSTLTPWSSSNSDNRSNSSTSFGLDTTNGTYWQWHSNTARGGGFLLDIDKDIGEEYTIGLKISFENTLGGWRKIIDYKNSASDTGFYFYNGGHLNFYNYGVNGASVTQPNQVVDMIVRRNKTTKEFEAYIVNNGVAIKDMSITDSSNQGVPAVLGGRTRLGFFFDDVATGSEASPGGKVYDLKIWDQYMDPDDVIEALRPGGKVIAHYIDEENDQVLPDKSVTGFIGDKYSFQKEEVYGYQYLRREGVAESGDLPNSGTKELSYIYKCLLPYTVTARYVDESGNKLCEDIIYQGEAGSSYQLTQLQIDDYEFVSVDGSLTGVYVKKPRLVTFTYKPEEIPPVLEEGMVQVSYLDETGVKIAEDITYKGYVGEAYTTSRLPIPGYEYKRVTGNPTGTYTKNPITVQYIYGKIEEEKGGTVIVHYLDDQGRTLGADVLFDGKIGDSYTAERKEFPKYEFDHAEGAEQGEIKQGVQVVNMIYVPLASNVLARYVDRDDLTIAPAEVYTGGIGQPYRTEKKEIDGYRFVQITEGKEEGVFSEEVHVVKYMYGRIGNVHVRYQDLDGNEIHDPALYTEFVDENYVMQPLSLYGYKLVRTEGNERGTYKVEDQTVTYVYECLMPYTVTARYVDEAGNKLCDDIVYQGEEGATYQLNQLVIDDYDFVRVEGEVTGVYTKNLKVVTFIYKKDVVLEEGTVQVSYRDEAGAKLAADITYKGHVGEPYATSQLTIPGYKLKEVNGNTTGTFTKEPISVRYIYTKAEEEAPATGGTVIVRYLDDQGYTISADALFEGEIGDSYTALRKEISRYQFDHAEGAEQGEIKQGLQIVNMIYVPLASNILARYVDRDGLTIAPAEIYSGVVGQPYRTEKKEIDGYRFVEIVEGREEGFFGEEVHVVKYMYGRVGNVHVNYLDLDGNEIHDPALYTEFIDEEYETKPLEIYSYELVRTEGNEKGKFQLQDQTINYIYEKINVGDLYIHMIEESGTKIEEDRFQYGKVGTDYEVEAPVYHGYQLIRTEGETKGVYIEEDTHVTFVYELLIPNTVTARYEDADGNLLCEDIVYKGLPGTSYKTSQLGFSGYEFVKAEGEESGSFKREPLLVTYIYKKKAEEEKPTPPEPDLNDYGTVIAEYVDEDGNMLYSDLTYMGLLGTQYRTSSLKIHGYELKEIQGETDSTYETEVKKVKYVYVEKETTEPSGGTVIVKYETEQGITLRQDEIFDGLIGDPYQAIRYGISGYVFERMEGPYYYPALSRTTRRMARAQDPVESEGEIEERTKVIVMIYKPVIEEEILATTVIARYVDKEGNLIHFDQMYNGLVNGPYQTEELTISGYRLVRIDGEENGIFGEIVQIVTYVYDKVGQVVIKVVDEDGNIIEEKVLTGFVGEKVDLDGIEFNIDGEKYIPAFPKGSDGVYTEETQEIAIVVKKSHKMDPPLSGIDSPRIEADSPAIERDSSSNKPDGPAVNTGDEQHLAFHFGMMLVSLVLIFFLKRRYKGEA